MSIIMPALNAADTIGHAVKSVLAQSFQDFELIIVNDGSSDATEAVVKAINDTRIRLFSQSNKGVSAARNVAISKSRGEWLAFLDADDTWELNKLEKQISFANDADFIYTRGKFIIDGKPGEQTMDLSSIPEEQESALIRLIEANYINLASVLMRKNLVTQYFNESFTHGEDYDLWLRLFSKPDLRIKRLNDILINYTVHDTSAMATVTDLELKLAQVLSNYAKAQSGKIKKAAEVAAALHFNGYMDKSVASDSSAVNKKQLAKMARNYKLSPKVKLKLLLYRTNLLKPRKTHA